MMACEPFNSEGRDSKARWREEGPTGVEEPMELYFQKQPTDFSTGLSHGGIK